jgi:hypothetical protein
MKPIPPIPKSPLWPPPSKLWGKVLSTMSDERLEEVRKTSVQQIGSLTVVEPQIWVELMMRGSFPKKNLT